MPQDIFSEYDICVLTETFVTTQSTINVRGFYNIHAFAKQDVRGRPSGGVTCLIKPGLTPFEVLLRDDDQLVVKTKIGIFICAYYRPDCSPIDVVDGLQQAITVVPNKERVILAGDLNCPIDKTNRKADIVLSYIKEEGLTLVNDNKVQTYIS